MNQGTTEQWNKGNMATEQLEDMNRQQTTEQQTTEQWSNKQ
jgi:hypothetical protein